MIGSRRDLVPGTRYHSWTVIGLGSKTSLTLCRCACGEIREVFKGGLLTGRTRSCRWCAARKRAVPMKDQQINRLTTPYCRGCRNLIAAIIARAIQDASAQSGQLFESAMHWLTDKQHGEWSFLWCCDQIEMIPAEILKAIERKSLSFRGDL